MPGSDPLVRSYLFLRTGIGIIGVALPILLVSGTILLEGRVVFSGSMSAYYYSVMRDVFVGSLWATGIFLICYQYDSLDDLVSTLAGICAIGVSLFPAPPEVDATQLQTTIGIVHGSFATSFFLMLAFMAIVLFTRKDPEHITDQKLLRNKIYMICGCTILTCVGLAALTIFVPYLHNIPWLQAAHPILVLESLATWAFGWAWFVKGEMFLLRDKKRV
jgi:uncharacterized membrane protein YbaN (DUF454 family)